jgi:hypothetical protein
MRSSSSISSGNNGFNGRFNDLNNNDMNNLRGGEGTTSPKSGSDYPIDPLKTSIILSTYNAIQSIPVLKAS